MFSGYKGNGHPWKVCLNGEHSTVIHSVSLLHKFLLYLWHTKAIEPPFGRFSSFSKIFKDLMRVDSFLMAYGQRSRVYEGDARTLAI